VYRAIPPLLLDFDTVPDKPYTNKLLPPPSPPDPSKWDGGLVCPFCRKHVSSTPGRTLHVKANHPEQFAQYLELLENLKTQPVKADVASESELKCPFCNYAVSSKPGRTNHVKGKHPERLDEYRQMGL
jgi:hypothetical protein